jgi:type IV secretory pathway TraG/TraD family ATPase VirD4
MNALVVQNRKDVAKIMDQRPLGTAAWLDSGTDALSYFSKGNFWVGRLTSGNPTGCHDDRHVFIGSGTRGGKGISVVIPNLIRWPGSVVVIDPKGENAIVTARRRANGSRFCKGMGQKVRILDPFDTVESPLDQFTDLKCAFNPMSEIRADREESVDIAGRIADSIIVSEGSSDSFFDDAAKGLLKALILHVATSRDFTPAQRTLVTVRRYVLAGDLKARRLAQLNAAPNKKIPSGYFFLAAAMMRNEAFGGVISDYGARLRDLDASPRTLASIVQVATTNTDFIESPGMKRCLAQSDFLLSELKLDPKGTSLYVTLPQRYMGTHYRWLRMMTALIIAEMEQVRGQPRCGYPVLMMLDEFPALRRMQTIENAAAQIAGFGVKLVFVAQTLAQLKDIYKDNWETLLANAGLKMFFFNDDHFTRQYVSSLIGDCEVVRTAQSSSSSSGGSWSSSRSTTSGSSHGMSLGHSHGSSMGGSGSASENSNSSSGMNIGYSISSGTGEVEGESYSESRGVSESIQKRPLVTPDEIGRMFSSRSNPMALVLVSGYQPLFLRRTAYFQEEEMEGCFDPHPDHRPPLTLAEVGAREIAIERERAAIAERKRREQMAAAKEWAEGAEARTEKERFLAQRRAMIAEAEAKCAAREALEKARRDRWRNLPYQLQDFAWRHFVMTSIFGGSLLGLLLRAFWP